MLATSISDRKTRKEWEHSFPLIFTHEKEEETPRGICVTRPLSVQEVEARSKLPPVLFERFPISESRRNLRTAQKIILDSWKLAFPHSYFFIRTIHQNIPIPPPIPPMPPMPMSMGMPFPCIPAKGLESRMLGTVLALARRSSALVRTRAASAARPAAS